MRTLLFSLFLAALAVAPMGCASGFRAGGQRAGVQAGAAVGPQPAPVLIPAPPPQ